MTWQCTTSVLESVRCSGEASIVSEPEDREKAHHQRCGYPSWTIKNMKEQQSQKGKTKERKDKNTEKSKDVVTLPYVKGVTEHVQQIFKHREIATAVKLHQNIRRILVHLKDKVEDSRMTNCVYQIPCKSRSHTYIDKQGEHLEEDSRSTRRRLRTSQPDGLPKNK